MTGSSEAGPARDEPAQLRGLPLTLRGRRLAGEELEAFLREKEEAPGILGDLARFLRRWQDPSPAVTVCTSGSTGEPRPFAALKVRMAASARATCAFLRLKAGDTALLAMPLRYIAGRMVVVRALTAGLDLIPVEPCASPLAGLNEAPVFAALTPMQVHASLRDPAAAPRLRAVRSLLLGGGAIPPELARGIADFPHEVWSSYGMTETLSHIALRRCNGPLASDWYSPLPGVETRLDEAGCLVIQAPRVAEGEIVTRDLAEMDGRGRFRILGRRDNVLNTGGVKVQTEDVEARLAPLIPKPFCITAVPDARLGEKIVLLHEDAGTAESLDALCRQALPAYWRPRAFFRVDALPRTGTGKPARQEARELARRLAGRE